MAAVTVTTTTLTAGEARQGDVLLDAAGKTWQRGQGENSWNTFSGPVVHYGAWSEEYGPMGRLILLVRDGKPAVSAEPAKPRTGR